MNESKNDIIIDKPQKIPLSHNVKVILLGDTNVGKTCILQKFFGNDVLNNVSPTIGANIDTLTFNHNGEHIYFQIWDSSGGYNGIPSAYLRGIDYAIVVFDVTN